ncbi:hypothetical protein kac65v151_gp166 [Nodularia phage vB_NspS-kac65v151]|jgi:hypothetical protein|uniref:Uncharacterized protein n=2 Tax=Ravarandavirus kac65v151 TaxID=2845689 RepID=A0A482MHW7_9CAUD|nr:hypothetical protein HWC12_gp151 [Nodularia phage vB_NspS-kac65v151]QBQ73196.1 hypothetical protein kac65v151_gp166 [Nodularia phage vB_NspS-kac65v151]QBQ73404.1 hypothetical protein kac65v161_gp166 [Nodularia phage vB_NspS-kac65v161]
MKHSADLKPVLFQISPDQITNYLIANGWVIDRVVDGHSVFSLEHGDTGCKLLLPQQDNDPDYAHRLLDILLVLQLTRSPSIGDIANDIKRFQVKHNACTIN